MTDYTAMTPGELYQFCGCDAKRWAEAFIQMKPDVTDEDSMVAWFANAMMGQVDFQDGQPVLNGDHAAWLLERGLLP